MPQHTAVATIHTNHGDIVVNLFGDQAPRTVQNFVGLSDGSREWTHPATGKPGEGALYTDFIFHRIIEGVMIQGGDPLGLGYGGPGYNFEDEFHPSLRHDRAGILSMANAGPNTNGSQFFINAKNNSFLDTKHTVFGKVTSGLEVVHTIEHVATGPGDRPIEPVVIEKITIA